METDRQTDGQMPMISDESLPSVNLRISVNCKNHTIISVNTILRENFVKSHLLVLQTAMYFVSLETSLKMQENGAHHMLIS